MKHESKHVVKSRVYQAVRLPVVRGIMLRSKLHEERHRTTTCGALDPAACCSGAALPARETPPRGVRARAARLVRSQQLQARPGGARVPCSSPAPRLRAQTGWIERAVKGGESTSNMPARDIAVDIRLVIERVRIAVGLSLGTCGHRGTGKAALTSVRSHAGGVDVDRETVRVARTPRWVSAWNALASATMPALP